jgi:hypothetical protein
MTEQEVNELIVAALLVAGLLGGVGPRRLECTHRLAAPCFR